MMFRSSYAKLPAQDVKRARAFCRDLEIYEPPPGCTFSDGIMDYGAVKAAWFKDSEGNLISLAQFVGQ